MRCEFCGRPITRLPRYINQVLQCSCGARYYIEVGDAGDVIESIADFLDVIDVREPEITIELEKIEVKYRDKKAIAVKIEECDDLEPLWMIFTS